MILHAFKRYERKFLLDESQLLSLLPLLTEHMDYDEYCPNGARYTVHDLYLDTPDRAIIRRCLQSPYFKEKLRLRYYNQIEKESDPCFLEYKKKIGKLGNKRRAQLSLRDARAFLLHDAPLQNADYMTRIVLDEIRCFLDGRRVQPAADIDYVRLAMFGKDDPQMRLTVDTEICARVQLPGESFRRTIQLVPRGSYLLEIKVPEALPLWLTHALDALGVYPVSHSKYGRAYQLALRQRLEESDAAEAAENGEADAKSARVPNHATQTDHRPSNIRQAV